MLAGFYINTDLETNLNRNPFANDHCQIRYKPNRFNMSGFNLERLNPMAIYNVCEMISQRTLFTFTTCCFKYLDNEKILLNVVNI